VTSRDVIGDLQELIDAIDRRLPRLQHVDEPAIAREAAELRDRAEALLARLRAAVAKVPETPAKPAS
jgi:hypothetical protein